MITATPRTVSTLPLPLGTSVSRYAIALALGNGSPAHAEQIASVYRDTPQVQACFASRFSTKAAVPALTTAEALTQSGIAREVLTLLGDRSIYERLKPRMRRVPFLLASPRQTDSGSGANWVGEAQATPLIFSYAFDSLILPPRKPNALVVVSRDLLRMGDPAAEQAIRDIIVSRAAAFVDAQLLTPTVSAIDPVRPAAITNGATAITSTGTTPAQIQNDLTSLLGAITTGGTDLVWVMKPTTLGVVSLKLGAALVDFGIPVIASANSPQQITLLDAGEVVYADDGDLELDVTGEAGLQMDTAPTNAAAGLGSPGTPTATSLVSLYQTNSVCFRTARSVNWQRVRDGSVAYMTVSY
jgi:hypothetical protein